jgi:Immunoglobulin-like domain of bacterial spore germination
MTDLRDALRRASGVRTIDAVDHSAVAQKAQRVIRRRRAMYAAGAALFVAVVGFSAFQVAEGNWFGRTVVVEAADGPMSDTDLVLHIEPERPLEGDNVVVTMENTTDLDLMYGDEYMLERYVDGTWQDITGEVYFPDIGRTIESGETVQITKLESLEAGRYRISNEAGAYGASKTFTVARPPDSEPEIDPIVVESPSSGDVVSSPVTVSGTADVYEATVSIRIRDANGDVLTKTFATATCGSGCQGDFTKEVDFEVETQQSGTIEVYSESAETGEPMFLQTIPVTLLPAEPEVEETPSEGERAAIEVLSPTPDALATSPVTVSGTANVFEANVRIRILDENGEILADTFTTATCGTGCRGDYRKRVRFSVDHEQPGLVQVFEESAENGEPINMVEIPVVLVPA